MAISTYAELKGAIVSYSKRSGTDILAELDNFIDLAEADIWKTIRLPEMDTNGTISTNTSTRFAAFPTGFIAARRLQIDLADLPPCDLDFKVPLNMRILDTAGVPYEYTVTDQFEFNRISDQIYTIELQYYKEETALSSSNTENAVLTDFPMVYLAGCMKYFALWAAKDDAFFAKWNGIFNNQIATANRKSRKTRYPKAPAGELVGGMVV